MIKRIIYSSIDLNNDAMTLLKRAKRKCKSLKYNQYGAVYVAPDDDYTCGCSIAYLTKQLTNDPMYTSADFDDDPSLIIDLMDEYKTFCSTYLQIETYRSEKYDILSRFKLNMPNKQYSFYENNEDVLKHVYEIASRGNPLEDTLLHWAHSTSSVDTMIRKIVEIKGDQIIFRGGPYGLGYLQSYYMEQDSIQISVKNIKMNMQNSYR